MPYLILMGVYAFIVAYIIIDLLKLNQNSDLRNISLMHSLLGFVISMLLVFRTNTAYDRWWEGRKLWGSLVNNSRNLALKINPLLSDAHADERAFYRTMIPNFAFALKNHLRGHFSEHEFTETPLFTLTNLRRRDHIPNQIAGALITKTYELQRRGILLPEHLLFLNPELQSLMDICGGSERIHKNPYSLLVQRFFGRNSYLSTVSHCR